MAVLAVLLLLLAVLLTSSTTSPKHADLLAKPNYRTPLCHRVLEMRNGTLEIPSALEGLHLQFGSHLWSDFWLKQDKSTGMLSGLEINILDELAQEAGFTYEMNILNMIDNDWTGFLYDHIHLYDMLTDGWWIVLPERFAHAAYSPFTFADASLVLVSLAKDEVESTFRALMQFSQPFTLSVWIVFFSTILLTGLVYWFLEARQNDVDFVPERACSLGMVAHGVTKSFLQLTAGGGFYPKSCPGKLLLASWTWCIVLLLAAYTANLASFLVVQASPVLGFHSLDQAVKQNLKICTAGDILSETAPEIKSRYPHYHFDTSISSVSDLGIKIEEGTCDGGILPLNEFHLDIKRGLQTKQRCKFEIVGDPLRRQHAGYMVFNDYSHKCSVLVRDVLAYHFARMDASGKLGTLIENAYSDRASACVVPDAEPADSDELGLDAMAGIFCIHAAGILVAIVSFFVAKLRKAQTYVKELEVGVHELESKVARISSRNKVPGRSNHVDKNVISARVEQVNEGEHTLAASNGNQTFSGEDLQRTLFGIKDDTVQLKESFNQMDAFNTLHAIKDDIVQLKEALQGKMVQL